MNEMIKFILLVSMAGVLNAYSACNLANYDKVTVSIEGSDEVEVNRQAVFTLEARTDANPNVVGTYQWKLDGVNLPNGSSRTLYYTPQTPSLNVDDIKTLSCSFTPNNVSSAANDCDPPAMGVRSYTLESEDKSITGNLLPPLNKEVVQREATDLWNDLAFDPSNTSETVKQALKDYYESASDSLKWKFSFLDKDITLSFDQVDDFVDDRIDDFGDIIESKISTFNGTVDTALEDLATTAVNQYNALSACEYTVWSTYQYRHYQRDPADPGWGALNAEFSSGGLAGAHTVSLEISAGIDVGVGFAVIAQADADVDISVGLSCELDLDFASKDWVGSTTSPEADFKLVPEANWSIGANFSSDVVLTVSGALTVSGTQLFLDDYDIEGSLNLDEPEE